MAEETLVESRIADSVALVKNLESQGDKPTVAVWHYFPDRDAWRLLIAGPTFDPFLPREEPRAIERLVRALHQAQLYTLSVGDVQVVRTDYPLLNATRSLVTTGPDAIIRAHRSDNMVNGIFIKEMLVLRAA